MGANIFTNGSDLVITGNLKNSAGAAIAGLGATLATGSLTIAQVKLLNSVPVELVAAPGAGKVIELLGGVLFYDYAAVYTESADNMAVKFENAAGAAASDTIEATGFLTATADKVIKVIPVKDVLCAVNKALVLVNTGDGEYGGTGSPIRFSILYAVHETDF
jgi:hypothetical protein